MLFLFLATIGASVLLQRKIQQEYEGAPDWKMRRQLVAKIEAEFRAENEVLDRELAALLAAHRALVIRRDINPLKLDLGEAMEELERDLAKDPLEEAFESLERKIGKEKKKKKGV